MSSLTVEKRTCYMSREGYSVCLLEESIELYRAVSQLLLPICPYAPGAAGGQAAELLFKGAWMGVLSDRTTVLMCETWHGSRRVSRYVLKYFVLTAGDLTGLLAICRVWKESRRCSKSIQEPWCCRLL